MIRRMTGRSGLNALKPQCLQVEPINKRFDQANRIVFTDVVVESFGEQRGLGAIFTFNETGHLNLNSAGSMISL